MTRCTAKLVFMQRCVSVHMTNATALFSLILVLFHFISALILHYIQKLPTNVVRLLFGAGQLMHI